MLPVLAGLAGLLLASNPRRKKRRRTKRNPSPNYGRDYTKPAFPAGTRVHLKKIPASTGTVQPVKDWLDRYDDPREVVPVKWDDIPAVSEYARGRVTTPPRSWLARHRN